MSYIVRYATAGDGARINEINRSALGYHCTLEKACSQLEKVLLRPTDRVFVVCDESDTLKSKAVGFLHAADYETIHAGSMKNIISLAVDDAYQGQGLGRLLLNAVEAWALDDQCEAVRLVSSFSRVKAHAFYQHCGYSLRKEQKNFIKYLHRVS